MVCRIWSRTPQLQMRQLTVDAYKFPFKQWTNAHPRTVSGVHLFTDFATARPRVLENPIIPPASFSTYSINKTARDHPSKRLTTFRQPINWAPWGYYGRAPSLVMQTSRSLLLVPYTSGRLSQWHLLSDQFRFYEEMRRYNTETWIWAHHL